MEINDADYELLVKKLIELKPTGGCDFCSHSALSIHGKIYQLTAFNEGKFVFGSPTIPLVAVQCDKCGNIFLFNAIHLGIVKMPEVAKNG